VTEAPSTPQHPILETDGLHLRFGKQRVLRAIDVAIQKGETVAVIGESGCGKTVLLKTLIGLVPPSKGDVRFDGRSLVELDDHELVEQRLRFGFVFQQAALFDSLNVFENVAFGLRAHRELDEAQLRAEVKDRLEEVGLSTEVVAKMPIELSGGMRKRVGLARALALKPEVMLYDEPTTGLDPIMSDVINELILRTKARRQATSVVVTHDMNSARKIADRIVMLFPLSRLKEGETQVIFDGTPAALEEADDPRVRQFVRGEAGDRLSEAAED
jgi:phospholipid/cholesterol/gamma-HCH transport system ATP-binding protein